jgi:hypothetical protein
MCEIWKRDQKFVDDMPAPSQVHNIQDQAQTSIEDERHFLLRLS